MPRPLPTVRALLVLFCLAAPVAAHFDPGAKIRTMILATEEDGTVAYYRTPMPLLFSDVIAEAEDAGTPLDTPFLYPETTGTGVRYRVSMEAIAADPDGFAERLARAFEWRQRREPVPVAVRAFRVIPRDPGRGFEGATAARESLSEEGARLDPVFGDAMVDVAYTLDLPNPSGTVSLSSGLPALKLPDGVTLDTHMIDDRR